MSGERYTPTDFTPLPVEVGQGPDSNPGVAVDTSVEAGQGRQVTRSRSGLKKALLFGGALALSVIGPDAVNAARDAQLDKTRAAIAKIAEEKPNAVPLQAAQVDAARALFKRKDNGPGRSSTNIEAAQKMAKSFTSGERLDPKDYLPEGVEISEDDKMFIAEGEKYALNRIVTKEGGEYIIAGRRHEKHIVAPVLVGGAHNDASSDINGDGKTEPWEVRESANLSARTNLKTLKPQEKIIIGPESAQVQVKPDTFIAQN